MRSLKPECYGKCGECFFYFINGCIALPGEDCFLMINQKQAILIINNKRRFDIPDQITTKLIKKFPVVENNVEY
jgi:hypothetical protein